MKSAKLVLTIAVVSNYSMMELTSHSLILLDPPNVNITLVLEQYGWNTVTLFLKWTPKSSTYSYNVSVIPQLELRFVGITSVQLTALYNTQYNVSIEASHVCNPHGHCSGYIDFYYAFCGNPENHVNDFVVVAEFNGPAIEGINVTFNCLPGFILKGPGMSTCTADGLWKPDPRELRCKAMATCDPPPPPPTNGYIIPYTSTIEGTTVIYVIQNCNQIGDHFVCIEYNVTTVCNEMGKWELNSGDRVCKEVPGNSLEGLNHVVQIILASVSVFSVSAFAFFIAGYFCRNLWQSKQKSIEISSPQTKTTQAPLYDEITLKDHCQQHLELNKNIAYGPTLEL